MSSNLSLIQFVDLAALLRKTADDLDAIKSEASKNAAEIRKRDDIIDELRDKNDMLRAEIKRLKGGEA